jgi:hypothetical protein
MNPPRWLRRAGLVLAAVALPVALAAATWALTGTSLGNPGGGTVGVDQPAGQVSTPPTSATTRPATTTTTTARPAQPTGSSTCDEPGDDRCGRGGSGSGRGRGSGGGGSGRGGGGDD